MNPSIPGEHDFTVVREVETRLGSRVQMHFCARCGRGRVPYVMAAKCTPTTAEQVQTRIDRKIRMAEGLDGGG